MKHLKLFEQFVNEGLSYEDYKKIEAAVEAHSKEIKDALEGSGHRYWKVEVLPEYDNLIGGYNLKATATDIVNRETVLESIYIKDAIRAVKALPFVSKARVSKSYNKKMLTVIVIGLKTK